MASKWDKYRDEIITLYKEHKDKSKVADTLIAKYDLPDRRESLRIEVSRMVTALQLDSKPDAVIPTQETISLTDDEYEIIKQHRALAKECLAQGIPLDQVKHYWYKSKFFSLFVKKEEQDYGKVKDDFIKEMKAHAPIYPVIKRGKENNDGLLSVVDIADAHFGKYATKAETGEDFNLEIAKKRFSEGIDRLCVKMQTEKIEKIVYIGGNDKIHIDNAINTTTSGTKQDVSSIWHEMYLAAKKCEVEALEKLLTIADVHFVHCPSNHDFLMGFFLADSISSHFHNNKNITFDVSPSHRKYMQWGNSLIGATHGDGAKMMDLSDLMKTECKKAWSESKYAYWYCHHIHHKQRFGVQGSKKVELERDGRGVTILGTGRSLEAEDYAYVEYLRTMTGTDRWHSTNGYIHSPKACEMFLHHKHYGQIERYTHLM